jgi:oxygen-independent coproporphyrinogen-3 oxidase
LLLSGFQERLDLSRLQEWTFEANPGSVSERKARLLREAGVNRISLGVQSFDDGLLELLGRDHSAAQAESTFLLLRRSGFENLNLDLMFGLPGQTLAQWGASLQRALALQPDHLSTYCLTYEEDTEFLQRYNRGEFRSDPEADADFFLLADDLLGGASFEHYEVSNYAGQVSNRCTTALTGAVTTISGLVRARSQPLDNDVGKISPITVAIPSES